MFAEVDKGTGELFTRSQFNRDGFITLGKEIIGADHHQAVRRAITLNVDERPIWLNQFSDGMKPRL